MQQNLEKQVKALRIYAACLTALVIVLAVLFALQLRHNSFGEITAKRINIVEDDGTIRMVISNEKQQHPGTIDGKQMSPRDRPAGMIFFNNEGDECGGLVYDGNKKSASMTYSIDQYKNDQIMQLQYSQDNDAGRLTRSYGFKLWDRPDTFTLGKLVRVNDSLLQRHDTAAYRIAIDKMVSQGLLGYERLFVGKTRSNETGLFIRDSKGIPRIKIAIDTLDNPIFEVLDANGHSIPFHP